MLGRLTRHAFLVVIVSWSSSLLLLLLLLHYTDYRPTLCSRGPEEVTYIDLPYPEVAERDGQDWKDSVNPLYRVFKPLAPAVQRFPRLRPTRFMPNECMESWFANGELGCNPDTLGPEERLDAIWFWVNGSDSRWAKDMNEWSAYHGIKSGEQHFREQNELLYSMRSVKASMGDVVKTNHLVLYDFPFNAAEGDLRLLDEASIHYLQRSLNNQKTLGNVLDHLKNEWRVAQTPNWLDFSKINQQSSRLRYAGHSEIYHLPTVGRDHEPLDAGEHAWLEREWKKYALPTYNSMAIESRLGFLPGLSDAAVAFEDDYFLLRPLAASDFHSPLYGTILRYRRGKTLIPSALQGNLLHVKGEVGGLYHANRILSKRFPNRERPHIEHGPKALTRGLQHELLLMFGEAITSGSSKRFRELHAGNGDVQTQWLQSALRVERWREALLWTWVVAKLGEDGIWGTTARRAVGDLFQCEIGSKDSEVPVVRGPRRTLEEGRTSLIFEQTDWEAPKGMKVLFSSLDGHLQTAWAAAGEENDKCTMDLNTCFGSFWTKGIDTTAGHIFKHVAFRVPPCGDCLIMALVTKSGQLGLSEFFPHPNATYESPLRSPLPDYIPPPHLPLTATWHEADFSLTKVMAATSIPGETVLLREYTMKLLSRYMYSHAQLGTEFHQLKTPQNTREIFDQVDNSGSSVLCLNDDIEEDYSQVASLVSDWFEKKWPDKAVWERA